MRRESPAWRSSPCAARWHSAGGPVDAWQQAEGTCRISGHALSGSALLPVSRCGEIRRRGEDGLVHRSRWHLSRCPPFGTCHSGTHRVWSRLAIDHRRGSPCDQTVDFRSRLRHACLAATAPATCGWWVAAPAVVRTAGRPGCPTTTWRWAAQAANGGRGQRFETLNADAEAATAGVETNEATDAAVRRSFLLDSPPKVRRKRSRSTGTWPTSIAA
jgi:hypothetical protein